MKAESVEIVGVIKCHPKYVTAVVASVEAYFASLDQHIPTIEGSIKVKHAKPRSQSANRKSSDGKSKRAPANGG